MGILAPFLFIILILTLGFRYNNWSLAFVVFLFSSGFAAMLAGSNIEEIKQNWNDRRCDLGIMVTSQLYKPASDPRTGGEFAAENFSFCTRKVFVSIIEMVLAPVYMMMNKQLDVTDSLNTTFDRFRVMQANFLKGFMKILEPFFQRFKNTGSQFIINQQKFLNAMGRAFGITQAILYIGMTLVITIENFVQLVINVIMIVMYIILGVMIILFPLILPVFGLIIFTCQTIGNSPFGYLAEDVCGELCFDPDTRILCKDGTTKPIGSCKLGDVFEDGTIIEGILHVSGKEEPIFVLDGIRVSGAHLVYYDDEWIPVAHHPSASPAFNKCDRLVCLRTSTRTIPLHGLTQEWTFRDWEELPTNLPFSDTIWDFLVAEILNQDSKTRKVPEEYPLLKPHCQVMFQTGEIRPVSQIQIGDCIYSSEGFTKVTGIYVGEANFSDNHDFTDGVWIQGLGEKKWDHPLTLGVGKRQKGFHLTTESGCFWIQTNQFSGFVRDFTEVGTKDISLTYNYTRQLLKKSFNREESCVLDSLSQVLSSYSPLIS